MSTTMTHLFRSTTRVSGLMIITAGIAGCLGGGGGGGGGGGNTTSLTDEDQVLGAALTGTQQFATAQDGLTDAADQDSEDAPDTAAYTQSMAPLSDTGEVPIELDCSSLGDGDGALRLEEGELFAIGETEFPDAFSNAGSLPQTGQTTSETNQNYRNDLRLRADCEVRQDGTLTYAIDGAADIMQLDNVNGSQGTVTTILMGGRTGSNRDDTPDINGTFESTSEFGDETTTSSHRGKAFTCEGCINGDFADFTGTSLDATNVSYIDSRMNIAGAKLEYQIGNSVSDPFVFRSTDAGGGRANVTLDGRMAFEDLDTDCGYDVTYATQNPVVIDNYDQTASQTVGGTLEITVNESNAMYTVTYESDGTVAVTDDQGNPVNIEPSDSARECGFTMEESNGSGSGGGGGGSNDDPAGTWVSSCRIIGADSQTGDPTAGIVTLSFDAVSSGHTESVDVYEGSESCDGQPTDTASYTFTYDVGDPVATENGAYEIDFAFQSGTSQRTDIFDIFLIEDGNLYLGAPDSGPDQPQYRPDTVDRDWTFTRE